MGAFSSAPVPRDHGATRSLVHHGSRQDPSDSASLHQEPAARPHAQVYISGLARHRCRPDLHCEQSSHRRWFPGLPSPRAAAYFAFVRFVELDEQTTSSSRTASLSGASPDFPPPNPLSGVVLIMMYSVHFQKFQALQALAGSCSPHALAGTYTLVLQARRRTCGRDPGHPPLPCQTLPPVPSRCRVRPCRLRPKSECSVASRCPACLRGGISSCICAFSGPQVARRRRASAGLM